MLKKKYLPYLLSYSIIALAIYSIQPYTTYPIGNTATWWTVNILILLFYTISKKYYFDNRLAKSMKFVHWYLLWNIFSIIRGIFIPENYWEWKGLVGNTIALMLPLVAYIGTNVAILQKILRYYIWVAIPLFLFFAFKITTDSYGFYLVPISFLMFFFPLLSYRWKGVILMITLLVIFIDVGARSNVIKFIVPIFLLPIYFYRTLISIKFLEWFRKLLFITPIILFFLAITNVFNIFKIDEYLESDKSIERINAKGEIEEDDITSDTRTFLYEDVIQTAVKYNSWWIGRSPALGNETSVLTFSDYDLIGRDERLGNEVAVLNIFTWTGIVGVVLYCLAFYRASYLAINTSNNIFSKILGIFVAFRWVYAWVEDVNFFTLNTFFLWIMIGLCMSVDFRAMTNQEIKKWIRGCFGKVIKKPIRKRGNQHSFANY